MQTAAHTTGNPNARPGRSQPAGGAAAATAGGAGGADGSSAAAVAFGPNPSEPAARNASQASGPRAAAASPSTTSDTDSEPTWITGNPRARASTTIAAPTTIGAPIARRTSSRDQAIGCRTAAATATPVRPTMINMNVRFGPLAAADGTPIAR